MVNTLNEEIIADEIIITVPVKILQNGAINVTPELPAKKKNAIPEVKVYLGTNSWN